ncbi:cilia- and flagella-associated protein 157 [Diretmus argenteus]
MEEFLRPENRYQRKCDELEVQSEDFTSRYSTLQQDKKDVTEYLKLCLAQKEEQLSELTESLVSLQQAKDLDKNSLELQLSQLRQEFQEEEKLVSENRVLASKTNLEEYAKQKEMMAAHIESLEEQLANQKEEHKDAIYSLEKKALLDNDRLQKEMHSHVKAEMQRFLEQKLPETTRLALLENAELQSRHIQVSDQNNVLLEENQTLLAQRMKLRVEVNVLEEFIKQMTRKSHSHHKVAEQLTEKCKQLQAELNDSSSAHQEHQLLQKEHTGLLAGMDALRKLHASVLADFRKSRAAVDRLEAELEEERRKRSHLESIQQEAAFTLKQALTEEPTEDSEVVANQMIQKLLVILDRLGNGHALAEFIPEKSRVRERQTAGPTPNRAGILNPVPRSRVQLSHSRPGDLGLIPRPAQKHGAAPSRTKDPLLLLSAVSCPVRRRPASAARLPQPASPLGTPVHPPGP